MKMLNRIVKMHFREEAVEEFLTVFYRYRAGIAAQSGCQSVSLLQDHANKSIFYTFSLWDNAESLEKYRQSALFQEVWPQTKKLFLEPALAWSLYEQPST